MHIYGPRHPVVWRAGEGGKLKKRFWIGGDCRLCKAPIDSVVATVQRHDLCRECWFKENGHKVPKVTLKGNRLERLVAFAARLERQIREAQTPQARKALEDKLRALGQEVGGKSPLKTSG
jgi:hypothetical protein